jgi:predicted transcriptional regulator
MAINVPRNDNDKQEEKEAVIRGLTQQASEIELHNIGSAAAPATAYTNQEGVGMFAQLREVGEENARLETRLAAVEKLCGEFRNKIDALAPVRNLAVAIRKRAYIQYEKVDAKSEELTRDQKAAIRNGNAAAHHGDFLADCSIMESDKSMLSPDIFEKLYGVEFGTAALSLKRKLRKSPPLPLLRILKVTLI